VAEPKYIKDMRAQMQRIEDLAREERDRGEWVWEVVKQWENQGAPAPTAPEPEDGNIEVQPPQPPPPVVVPEPPDTDKYATRPGLADERAIMRQWIDHDDLQAAGRYLENQYNQNFRDMQRVDNICLIINDVWPSRWRAELPQRISGLVEGELHALGQV
jgi:hypothetical protein